MGKLLTVGIAVIATCAVLSRYHPRQRRVSKSVDGAAGLLSGFKELKHRERRGEALQQDIIESAARMNALSVESNVALADKYVFGRFHYFAVLAVIVIAGFLAVHTVKDLTTPAAAWYFRSTWLWAAVMAAGTLIYGECGGFMVLGETLTDADGAHHKMADLLPVVTSFEKLETPDCEPVCRAMR